MHVDRNGDQWRITKNEFKELLNVFNFYLIVGLMLGITAATIAVNGGIVFVKSTYSLPVPPRFFTAAIVMAIGLLTSLMAYLVLLPAELKIIRRRLAPKLLAQRLSRRK